MNQKFLATVVVFVFASAAIAQQQQDLQRFERQLEQIRRDTRLQVNPEVPLGQRVYLDYGGFTSLNYLTLDDSNLNNRTLREYDLTLYAHLNLDGVHDFFVRGRGFYRDFNNGDAFDSSVNGTDGHLERAYYQFNLARYLAAYQGKQIENDVSIKLGRDFIFWGNGLTLAQELDGGQVDVTIGPMTLSAIAGITPKDTVDIDSSRPDFDDNTKRGFFGAILSTKLGDHRPYVYGLAQRDWNNHSDGFAFSPDQGASTITTAYDYNSYYIGIGATGAVTDRISYGVEAVYEGGDTLSSSIDVQPGPTVVQATQDRDDIEAWALDLQLNYVPGDTRNTRFIFETVLASGDPDRLVSTNTIGGNRAGTKDHSFNAFGIVNTGLAFAPAVSNLTMIRVGASTFPFPEFKPLRRLQVGTDLFAFGKLQHDAPIDEPTTGKWFLGGEQDLYLNWQISSDVGLSVRWGYFVPGDAIVADGKIRQFVYTGITFAF
jgi:hypothetical protein